VTVAIGLVCSDGVLVASDSMGSTGRVAAPIVKVHAMTAAPTVWTYAGSLFMGQQVEEVLSDPTLDKPGVPPTALVEVLPPRMNAAYSTLSVPPGGSTKDLTAHATEVLILGWHDGKPTFSRVQHDLAVVDCHADRLVAIGSGHEYASVVRAALAHYLDSPVDLHLGTVLAYRVISTVCDVSSWNVAAPVQIGVADDTGARVLSPDQIDELGDLSSRWVAVERSSLATARDRAAGGVDNDLPTLRAADPGAGTGTRAG